MVAFDCFLVKTANGRKYKDFKVYYLLSFSEKPEVFKEELRINKMALVAYGSSGESSDSEDESQQQQLLTAKSVISNGAAGGGSGTSNAASTISGSISKVEHKADRKKNEGWRRSI